MFRAVASEPPSAAGGHKPYTRLTRTRGMEVQVLEFDYDRPNVDEIESQLNSYFAHHDIRDVQITQSGDRLLVFCFYEE